MIKKILNNVTSCCIVSVSISACTIHVALILIYLTENLFQGIEKMFIICVFFPPLLQFVATILGFCAFFKSSSNSQHIGSMLCIILSIIVLLGVIVTEMVHISMKMNAPHLA